MEEKRGAYRILVRKAEVKSALGRLGRGWKDDIKMDLEELR
jgi:hypothetical protein